MGGREAHATALLDLQLAPARVAATAPELQPRTAHNAHVSIHKTQHTQHATHNKQHTHTPAPAPTQFGSGLGASDLATLRGRVVNTLYFLGSRVLSTALGLINTRGMAPIRAAHGLPRGGAGGSCVPLVELCANSWLLEPPRPLGPPQVRGGG